MQTLTSPISADALEILPEDYFAPLDLAAIFGARSDAPLEIDLGCGDGAFLTAMAAQAPGRNFIGVERLLGRVRRTCRRNAQAGNGNVRVIRIESFYFLKYLLPAGTASVIHVMFPDPWPKKRHHSRRLVQTEFLEVAHAALQAGGELRLTTDNLPYFQHMEEVFSSCSGFEREPWEPDESYPQTDFEARFRAQGLPIYRALLRKKG